MKNILRIFKKDVIRIHKNVIALIVIMGITIVPCCMHGLTLQEVGIHTAIQGILKLLWQV